jgi:hypothetical protein
MYAGAAFMNGSSCLRSTRSCSESVVCRWCGERDRIEEGRVGAYVVYGVEPVVMKVEK